MTGLINAWGEAWMTYFGMAVIQNTIFLIIIFAGLYVMRNSRASLRYNLCLVGLVKLLLPPFLATGYLGVSGRASGVVSLIGITPSTPASVVGTQRAVSSTPHLGVAGLLLIVWSACVVTYLAVAVWSALRLRGRLSNAVPIGVYRAGMPGRGKRVEIRKSQSIPLVFTYGLLRPRVYVPQAWEGWSEDRRRMVLAHEIAHIDRWDRFAQALQLLVRAIYWFHPLLWLLDRKIDKYREMACDDAATAGVPRRATAYSNHLVEIAETAVRSSLSWGSASALLRQKNGLLDRVRYQLEVGKMKRVSTRTRTVVFALLVILVLPLSWYCGRAETEHGSVATGSTSENIKGHMQEVSIGLKPERRVSVGGDIVELEELGDVLEAKFPTDRENVVVRLTCEDSVGMALVSEVHEILVGLDLMKVIYEGPAAEGLPLVLPSLDLQEKLEEVMAKHGMLVKVDLPGRAIVDGKPVKLTGIKKAIQERLATDPHLVVSLVWAPTSRFEDFMMVLALAKEAGAQRIAVQIGS